MMGSCNTLVMLTFFIISIAFWRHFLGVADFVWRETDYTLGWLYRGAMLMMSEIEETIFTIS